MTDMRKRAVKCLNFNAGILNEEVDLRMGFKHWKSNVLNQRLMIHICTPLKLSNYANLDK